MLSAQHDRCYRNNAGFILRRLRERLWYVFIAEVFPNQWNYQMFISIWEIQDQPS